MVRRSTNRKSLPLILAAVLWLGGWIGPGSHGQDRAAPPAPPPRGEGRPAPGPPPASPETTPIRVTRNVAGDSKPLIFQADEVSTWSEGNYQVLMLRGQVLINQGVLHIRCQSALAWLDRKLNRERGLWNVQLYCEGDVTVDTSSDIKNNPKAVVELTTRGEVRLVSQQKKLAMQDQGKDPLVVRGRKECEAQLAKHSPGAAPGTVTPASNRAPMLPESWKTTPSPGGTLKSAGYNEGNPLRPPVLPVAPVPSVQPPTLPTAPPATPLPIASPTGPKGPMGPVGPTGPEEPTPPEASNTPLSQRAAGLIPVEQTAGINPAARWGTGVGGEGEVQQAGYFDVKTVRAAGQSSNPFPLDPAGPQPGTIVPVQGGTTPLPPTAPIVPVPAPSPPGGGPPPGISPGQPQPLPSRGSVVPPTPLPPPSKPGTPPRPAAPPSPRSYAISPRFGQTYEGPNTLPLPNGESAIVVTGGVILTVRTPDNGVVDIEADRVVIFTHDGNPRQMFDKMRQPGGSTKSDLEFYLAGHVEIREATPPANPAAAPDTKTLRADEVYYDVNRNVALALNATLELRSDIRQTGTNLPLLTEPFIVKAVEIRRVSETTFEMSNAEFFSSKMPADPGLKATVADATVVDGVRPKTSIFGWPVIDRKTGQQIQEKVSIVTARNVFFELEDVPFFYLPYLKTNARDPLGPVQNILIGYSRMFGFSSGLTFNMFKLLGIQRPDGVRWRLDLDYLSRRGPAAGTRVDYFDNDFFGLPATVTSLARGNIIYDHSTDILGGTRLTNEPPNPPAFNPPGVRGRALWRESIFDLPEGFTVQGQVHYLSDRNYQEQYFKSEFDNDINPATWIYLKQNPVGTPYAWTLESDAHIRSWINEGIWLPRVDGYLIGQSLIDNLFTYSAHGSAGYGQLRISTDPEPQVSPTDRPTNTGRFDLMQELDLPVTLGAFKVVPYTMLDLAQYTHDLYGDEVGRVWGAVGTRLSLQMSRLYADACSELFNVKGINHKITFGVNAFGSRTNVPYQNLPQLDRLNDDATDMALRDIRPDYQFLYPSQASNLLSPLFDPQTYAVRRLVLNRIDTLASTEVVQTEIRQRWQTKRGYPGLEHIIDWMTLDLSASFFPRKNQDDFGSYWSLLTYDWLWNVGDRTALFSSGWYDPIPGGARTFNIGALMNRPDRTNFSLSYRQIDPLQSRAVTGTVTYIFSPKYALTAGITYDFGSVPVLSETLVLTRVGSDLQVSMGLGYNNLQNNFSLMFEIVPTLAASSKRNSISGLTAAPASASWNDPSY